MSNKAQAIIRRIDRQRGRNVPATRKKRAKKKRAAGAQEPVAAEIEPQVGHLVKRRKKDEPGTITKVSKDRFDSVIEYNTAEGKRRTISRSALVSNFVPKETDHNVVWMPKASS